MYRIKISRTFSCSPMGAKEVSFEPGVYEVPEDMSADIAARALRSGRGVIADEGQVKKPAPFNKVRKIERTLAS